MDKHILKVSKRTLFGRKVKRLREEGLLPVNVFGKNIKSVSLEANTKDFMKVFEKAGETGLVYLDLEDTKDQKPVLITHVQVDPVRSMPLHADLHQVDLKEKVTANVPIKIVGESPTEKQNIGTVVQHTNDIEVEALPTDLPEEFEVNVSELLEVDQAIFVKDLKVDRSKVEIKTDPEAIVVKVEPPQKEEEVVPSASAEVETPATEGTPATETPDEGEAASAKE